METKRNHIHDKDHDHIHNQDHEHNHEHSHDLHHGHHGHHHHDHHIPESLNRTFIFCIALNVIYVVIEAAAGFFYNSVGLLSDAGHNLSDVFSLLLALIAFRMAGIKANSRFTYGYRKMTILISLANSIILLVAVGAIVMESIYRIKNPSPISGGAISITAGIGIAINGLTTWLLMKDKGRDLNVKGAYLHMLMDTLVSVGVVVSGIIISFTGWNMIDSVISMAIAVIILISTYRLLKESLFLTLDAVPDSVNMEGVREGLSGIHGIKEWHHLHVWAMSTTENAATLHVVIENLAGMEQVKTEVKELLAGCGISHSTIEFESPDTPCSNRGC